MKSFSHPFASWVLALALASPVLLLPACGMVTGLGNDYTFDLEGGAAAADGAVSDGAADGAADSAGDSAADAPFDAGVCTNNELKSVNQEMSGVNGNALCKECMRTTCCSPTALCVQTGGGCRDIFDCELQCTSEVTIGLRNVCIKQCVQQVNPVPQQFKAVAACPCPDCGFQAQ